MLVLLAWVFDLVEMDAQLLDAPHALAQSNALDERCVPLGLHPMKSSCAPVERSGPAASSELGERVLLDLSALALDEDLSSGLIVHASSCLVPQYRPATQTLERAKAIWS